MILCGFLKYTHATYSQALTFATLLFKKAKLRFERNFTPEAMLEVNSWKVPANVNKVGAFNRLAITFLYVHHKPSTRASLLILETLRSIISPVRVCDWGRLNFKSIHPDTNPTRVATTLFHDNTVVQKEHYRPDFFFLCVCLLTLSPTVCFPTPLSKVHPDWESGITKR